MKIAFSKELILIFLISYTRFWNTANNSISNPLAELKR